MESCFGTRSAIDVNEMQLMHWLVAIQLCWNRKEDCHEKSTRVPVTRGCVSIQQWHSCIMSQVCCNILRERLPRILLTMAAFIPTVNVLVTRHRRGRPQIGQHPHIWTHWRAGWMKKDSAVQPVHLVDEQSIALDEVLNLISCVCKWGCKSALCSCT